MAGIVKIGHMMVSGICRVYRWILKIFNTNLKCFFKYISFENVHFIISRTYIKRWISGIMNRIGGCSVWIVWPGDIYRIHIIDTQTYDSTNDYKLHYERELLNLVKLKVHSYWKPFTNSNWPNITFIYRFECQLLS